LRRERQQSPRAEADSAHVAVKTEMLQMRVMENKPELVRWADFDALIDGIAGVTLTALSSLPARCAPRGDLATQHSIERVVFEVRTEIAKVCQQTADKCGEPAARLTTGVRLPPQASQTALRSSISVVKLALAVRNWRCCLVFYSYQMDPNSPR
jgi:hypothetical protein